MKGSIVQCIGELVVSNFGKEKWEQSLEAAGLNKATMILPISDVDDAVVAKVVQALCNNLGLSLHQVADAFGDYWVNVYSQKLYGHFYKTNKTARDLLLDVDAIHLKMTQTMKNAKPPRFEYEWMDDKTLIIHYRSHRGLIDFVAGLAKGVGKYYHEQLSVKVLDPERVEVKFA